VSAVAAAAFGPDRADISRWGTCFAAILALHAALIVFLASRAPAPATGSIELPAVVMIDMAPPPAAPAPQPVAESAAEPEAATSDAAPEPEPMENTAAVGPEPAPPALVEPIVPPVPPPPKAAVTLPAPPKPQPKLQPKPLPRPKPPEKVVEKRQPKPVQAAAPKRAEPQARRLSAEPASAQRTASLPASASAGSSNPAASAASAASWRSQLVGYLQRNLRYPPGSRGGGVASVRFSMNRAGHVLSAGLASSAGSAELDAAALALFRGGGLPPPPADVPGATFSFTIPIRFSAR
jgi:periplasmic protein TonB